MFLFTDRLGQTIHLGDYIIYGAHKSTSIACLYVGKVAGLDIERDKAGQAILDARGNPYPLVSVYRAYDYLNPQTVNKRISKLAKLRNIVVLQQPPQNIIDLYARHGL